MKIENNYNYGNLERADTM